MGPGASPRVFIVEDEEFLQAMYRDLLVPEGFEIVGLVGDGNEAVPALTAIAETPDLVLLDHRLPGKSGLDVMVEIAASFPNLQVMFVSADTTVKDAAVRAGAARFLAKPFRMGELFLAMHELLDARGRRG